LRKHRIAFREVVTEYDLHELLKGGIQGKYAGRFQEAPIWFYWTVM